MESLSMVGFTHTWRLSPENPDSPAIASDPRRRNLDRSLRHGQGDVQKRIDHGDQPLGAVHERHMRGARKYRELGPRQADEIADNAAAEQAKHLDRVLR